LEYGDGEALVHGLRDTLVLVRGVCAFDPVRRRVIEDLPATQRAIAAEVELPRADAAAGHPDVVEALAAPDLLRSPLIETPQPSVTEFLVRWHEMAVVRIGRAKRPGHWQEAGNERSGYDTHARAPEELAARQTVAASGRAATATRSWGGFGARLGNARSGFCFGMTVVHGMVSTISAIDTQ